MTYNEFIEKCKNRQLEEGCYVEVHHVVPKCMGGSNDDSNLIKLTGQEHYEAHKLLALENPDVPGLQTAWWNMCQCKGIKGGRKVVISADEYAEARERHAKRMSELYAGSFKGTSAAGWNKGVPTSEEAKKKISEKLKGRIKSEEECRHISESLKGKPRPYMKEKMRKWIKEHPTPKGKDCPIAKTIKCLETGEIFFTIKDAAEKLNCDSSAIVRCCKGKSKQHKGYHFEYCE